MKKLFLLLLLCAFAQGAGARAQGTYTNVTSSNMLVDNGSGAAINPPSGSNLCFQGTNAAGAAITYTPSGGSPVSGPVCQTFTTGGALSGSLQVANVATASPAGLLFTITITNGATTYLTLTKVSVSGVLFQLNQYSIPGNGTVSGIGYPHIGCNNGAQWASTTVSPGASTCQLVSGVGTWTSYPSAAYCPAGQGYIVPQVSGAAFCIAPQLQGLGAPTGACINKSTYFQQDASAGAFFWGCVNNEWSQSAGGGGGGSGLTSFQGRTTPAATLQSSDIQGVLANSPFGLTGSRGLLIDASSGTPAPSTYWGLDGSGNLGGSKNLYLGATPFASPTITLNYADGSMSAAAGSYTVSGAGALAFGGGSAISSSDVICQTSGAHCPAGATVYYQLIKNNGSSLTPRGVANYLSATGIQAVDNSGASPAETDISLLQASSTQFGAVKVDGVTISATGGVISLTYSSATINGTVCSLGGSCTVTGAPSGSAGGDLSGSYPNPTVAKVNGVAYAASPSTNTLPVVTGSNTTTYEKVPNAALANPATNVNGQTCTLGSSCTVTAVASNTFQVNGASLTSATTINWKNGTGNGGISVSNPSVGNVAFDLSKPLAGSGTGFTTGPTTTTTGDCVNYADSFGTIGDAGAACGSGGGSQIGNAFSIQSSPYYATASALYTTLSSLSSGSTSATLPASCSSLGFDATSAGAQYGHQGISIAGAASGDYFITTMLTCVGSVATWANPTTTSVAAATTTASITANSPIITVTSTTGLVKGDVVTGTGIPPVAGTVPETVIVGFGSGTTVYLNHGTIATNASASLTFTPRLKHDDTAALQAVANLASYSAAVDAVCPAGVYPVNGPFQNTSTANAIIVFPALAYSSTSPMVGAAAFTLEGTTLPTQGASTGCVIQSDQSSTTTSGVTGFIGSIFGSYSANTGSIPGNQSNINLQLKNITFRTYDDPQIIAQNRYLFASSSSAWTVSDTGFPINCYSNVSTCSPVPTLVPTHSGSFGIITPQFDFQPPEPLYGDQSVGYYNLLQTQEHTHFSLFLGVAGVNCLVFGQASGHLIDGTVDCEWNSNDLTGSAAAFDIRMANESHYAGLPATNIINDTPGNLHGVLNYESFYDGGNEIFTGGANVVKQNVGFPLTNKNALTFTGGITMSGTGTNPIPLTITSNGSGSTSIALNNTSSGAHNFTLATTGSGAPGYFSVYDITAGVGPWAVHGINSTTGTVIMGQGTVNGWNSSANAFNSAIDTGLSRDSANVVDCGNGTLKDKSCTFNAGSMVLATASTLATNLSINNTSSGAHSFNIAASGSGNHPGWLAFFDTTATNGPMALNGSFQNLVSGLVLGWSSDATDAFNAAADTGFSRGGPGIVDCGNGTSNDKSCTLNAAVLNLSETGCTSCVVLSGTSAGTNGTSFTLTNTSTGGKVFNLGSTGSGNTSGAGLFTVYDTTDMFYLLNVFYSPVTASSIAQQVSGGAWCWAASSTTPSATSDTCIWRGGAAKTINVGSGTGLDRSGTINAGTLNLSSLAASSSICTDGSKNLTTSGCLNPRSWTWNGQSAFVSTLLGAAGYVGGTFYAPAAVTLNLVTITATGTISCAVGPTVQIMDLGTSATTVYGSATVLSTQSSALTADGVFSSGSGLAVTITAGHYIRAAISGGTCATAPTLDVMAQVQ